MVRPSMTAFLFSRLCRAAWATITCMAMACGHASWDGRTYAGHDVRFRTGPVSSSWRPIEADNAWLAFRDSVHDLVISVNGRCGKDSDDVPLTALTQHLFMYFTERQIADQKPLMLDGREALRTDLAAKLDGVPRRFVVYVLKKDGCVYDFVLIAAPGASPAVVSEFDLFVAGFSTTAAAS